ncbi:Superoxide dismutase [Fe] [uncultured archaeon]|nr:Superoxide dismutase [Fe] [uncultured archaeon]
MVYTLPKLNFEYNSLEPFMDAQTVQIHHSKHHQTYTDKLNEAVSKHPELFKKKPEELLKNNLALVPEDIKTAVRNHGGGYWNHCFFWEILAPGKQTPSEKFKKIIEKEFESFDKFKEQFSNAALTQFGSGWAWLVLTPEKKLKIYNLPNQDSPISKGDIPLLTIDVWEHAYYLKYQNKRVEFIANFWNIINWKKVEELYKSAIK